MTTRRDPGLQSERTLLAWRRTALGLLANAVLLVVAGLRMSSMVPIGLGLAVCAVALGFLATLGAAYRGSLTPAALGAEPVVRLVTGLLLTVGGFDLYVVLRN